jgi:hypothetical protein
MKGGQELIEELRTQRDRLREGAERSTETMGRLVARIDELEAENNRLSTTLDEAQQMAFDRGQRIWELQTERDALREALRKVKEWGAPVMREVAQAALAPREPAVEPAERSAERKVAREWLRRQSGQYPTWEAWADAVLNHFLGPVPAASKVEFIMDTQFPEPQPAAPQRCEKCGGLDGTHTLRSCAPGPQPCPTCRGTKRAYCIRVNERGESFSGYEDCRACAPAPQHELSPEQWAEYQRLVESVSTPAPQPTAEGPINDRDLRDLERFAEHSLARARDGGVTKLENVRCGIRAQWALDLVAEFRNLRAAAPNAQPVRCYECGGGGALPCEPPKVCWLCEGSGEYPNPLAVRDRIRALLDALNAQPAAEGPMRKTQEVLPGQLRALAEQHADVPKVSIALSYAADVIEEICAVRDRWCAIVGFVPGGSMSDHLEQMTAELSALRAAALDAKPAAGGGGDELLLLHHLETSVRQRWHRSVKVTLSELDALRAAARRGEV